MKRAKWLDCSECFPSKMMETGAISISLIPDVTKRMFLLEYATKMAKTIRYWVYVNRIVYTFYSKWLKLLSFFDQPILSYKSYWCKHTLESIKIHGWPFQVQFRVKYISNLFTSSSNLLTLALGGRSPLNKMLIMFISSYYYYRRNLWSLWS